MRSGHTADLPNHLAPASSSTASTEFRKSTEPNRSSVRTSFVATNSPDDDNGAKEVHMTLRTCGHAATLGVKTRIRIRCAKFDLPRHSVYGLAAGIAMLFGVAATSTSVASAANRSDASVVVSTRFIRGVGTVLVNVHGRTLYSPIQEQDGKIKCTGACENFWFPLTTSSKVAIRAGSISGRFSEVKRPGSDEWQVAYEEKPLYTFRFDNSAGEAKGNGFVDHFGGMTFDWRAVVVSGTAKTSPPKSTSSSGGGGGYY
jgi:predicted lipoprotein with Yx(FWY)xxD motif